MITLAVTGGIGAGKSETVADLGRLGARTIDADRLGHVAYARGSAGFDDVVARFGSGVVGADGEIDRAALGALVFSDPKHRRDLEAIVWHRIRAAIVDTFAQWENAGAAAGVLEAAVLFEAGWEDLADAVWTVEATYHQRLARIVAALGMSEADARRRIDAQMSADERIERADVVVWNDGDRAQLRRRVGALWARLTNARGLATGATTAH